MLTKSIHELGFRITSRKKPGSAWKALAVQQEFLPAVEERLPAELRREHRWSSKPVPVRSGYDRDSACSHVRGRHDSHVCGTCLGSGGGGIMPARGCQVGTLLVVETELGGIGRHVDLRVVSRSGWAGLSHVLVRVVPLILHGGALNHLSGRRTPAMTG